MAATCKSCGAPIIWIQSPKGKWIPCDEGLIPYKADRSGKEAIVTQKGEIIRCNLTFEGKGDGAGRIAHWATCPAANLYRRRKNGRT